MKNYVNYFNSIIVLVLLFTFGACQLSGEQEKRLNENMSAYIHAHNACQPISLAALTYPPLVSEWKSMGDSIFKQNFDCEASMEWHDPTVKKTVKNGSVMHVLIDLKAMIPMDYKQNFQGHQLLIAISEDGGESWFFIKKEDYVNKSWMKSVERLLHFE